MGAAVAPASASVSEPHIVALGRQFALRALGYSLGCGARGSPTTGAKTGRTAHAFIAQGCTCRSFTILFKSLHSCIIIFELSGGITVIAFRGLPN